MAIIHADIEIKGIVQGVGFRPFVHKQVQAFALQGFVRNTSTGADIALEGEETAIDAFVTALRCDPPTLALIEEVTVDKTGALQGFAGFEIVESRRGAARRTLISPDVGICPDCLRELQDPADRRYRYPFINCTNCGPRFTIIQDIPYDRKHTTMAPFPMCPDCAAEYGDIEDRRYHAQPDCCPECGPRLIFLDDHGQEVQGDPIALAQQMLRQGKIVAVKGLGGIHLACRCDDPEIVRTLRQRKRRDEKPFAIMCRDVETARRYAHVTEDEARHLTSHRRPIVLLRKKDRAALPHISENGWVGVMLPYTPVHYLLLEGDLDALVMTSANLSDLPILYQDEAAAEALQGIADGFLRNDRAIHTRCDDSLLWVYKGQEYFARRSRGYVPYPIGMGEQLQPILACGAEQKASFAMAREHHVFLSQHIGDLKNLETLDNYEGQIAHFQRIFDIQPQMLVCDLHPDYLSTEYAQQRAAREGLPLRQVQHHHAHMASCMADNGYDGSCIGIVWDGTGCGTDGTVWGAEFLSGDFTDFRRRGTIRPIPLPGGDRATREIFRCGDALRHEAGLPCENPQVERILQSGINCPAATSMGRLFDGAAAILGIRQTVSYEGQGAVLLEAAAAEDCTRIYPYTIEEQDGMHVFDWREMVRCMVKEHADGVPTGESAAAFMNTLADFAVCMAARIAADTGMDTVALSGGTFQNMYLLKRLDTALSAKGLRVLTHRRVSANDEGISLGQLMIAQRGGGR